MQILPFERIAEAADTTSCYHFRIEHTPGLFYEGEIDHSTNQQYFRLGPHLEPLAEAFWQGEVGIGHSLVHDAWRRLGGRPFANLMQAAATILRDKAITSIRQEGDLWFVDLYGLETLYLDNPATLARALAGHGAEADVEQAAECLSQLAERLRVAATIAVSRETFQIVELTVHISSELGEAQMRVAFSAPQWETPDLPRGLLEQLADTPAAPVETLLIMLPTLGGWDTPTEHSPWAQRSIDLIAEQDKALPIKDRKYTEIYEQGATSTGAFAQKPYPIPQVGKAGPAPTAGVHHPIVIGAWHEDDTSALPAFYTTWFSTQSAFLKYLGQGGYGRYYHHFGGESTGLKYQDYMDLAEPPPAPCTSGGDKRYYSARDWGYGPARLTCASGEVLNRLTFQRALEQYNAYTYEGKRNAYLLLGHVVHLLQDVGEPDHAALADHAASGMNEPEAYSTFYLCEIGAGAAAGAACAPMDLICYGITYGIAYGICKATIDSNVVGYERLVSEKWHLSRVEQQIKKTGVVTKANYDAYFHDMQQAANAAVTACKVAHPGADFDLPLGCSSFMGIPGLDPNIDMSDEEEREPYLDLTDKIAPQVVTLTAGFIQHFFDVANYPPYLKQVMITQWDAPGRPKPTGFGKFADDTTRCRRYWAEWKDAPPASRSLVIHQKQSLSLDRPAYLFLHFGPSGIGPTRGRYMKELTVVFKGTYPGTGVPVTTTVAMKLAEDSQLGPYYWGAFTPRNCCADPYMLTLEVTGKDAGPHYSKRQPSGEALDASPATMAHVNINSPTFAWLDYTAGSDTTHTIIVARFAWRLDIQPLHLVIDRTVSRGAGELVVQLEQQHWDCQWEPTWGTPNCPVEWRLKPDISLQGSPTGPAAPDSFGIEIMRELRYAGIKLRITAAARAKAGTYVLDIEYTLGDPAKTYTLQIAFDVV